MVKQQKTERNFISEFFGVFSPLYVRECSC